MFGARITASPKQLQTYFIFRDLCLDYSHLFCIFAPSKSKKVWQRTYAYPKDFNGEDYFEDCFGIIAAQDVNVETVKLKVSAGQANYLRSLTLHQTQREIKRTDEYSIFALRLRPTFDFQQEILSMGSDVEVLAPDWFREDTADRVKAMWDKYKEDKA